jgi:hypothetical protein
MSVRWQPAAGSNWLPGICQANLRVCSSNCCRSGWMAGGILQLQNCGVLPTIAAFGYSQVRMISD